MINNILILIFERILYRCLEPGRLVLNVLAGILLVVLAVWCLQYHEKKEEGFISLSKKQITHFLLLVIMAVVFVSPLPLGGKGDMLKTISMFVSLFILAVTSYMDKQTGTFVNGYMLIGCGINLMLCIIGALCGYVSLDKTVVGMIIGCMVVNVVLSLVSYSPGDAGLIQMALFSFLLMDVENVVFAFVLCELIASIFYVISFLPKAVRRIKNKESLRFPFTLSIMVGVVVTFFILG